MPQFDPTFFAPQLVWLFIAFTALYVLMASVALPKIGAVLDERQRKISDSLDRAAQLKAEADAAVATYEKALSESRAHAHTVIRETADRLGKQAEERTRALGQQLAEKIKSGEAHIAAARDKALANVRDVSVDVAGAAVARLIGHAPDAQRLEAAVGAALKEQGQ